MNEKIPWGGKGAKGHRQPPKTFPKENSFKKKLGKAFKKTSGIAFQAIHDASTTTKAKAKKQISEWKAEQARQKKLARELAKQRKTQRIKHEHELKLRQQQKKLEKKYSKEGNGLGLPVVKLGGKKQ